MALYDLSAQFVNRLAVTAPQISTLGYTTAYNWALALLSTYEDLFYLITQNMPNLSVLLAYGTALDLLGSDVNVARNLGTYAILLVQFSVDVAVTGTAMVFNPETEVETYGDSVSTISVVYATQSTATISVGSTTSNLVLAMAETAGSVGNVQSGNIVQMVNQVNGVSVTNNPAGYPVPTSTTTYDGYGQILGIDPDTDSTYRARILAALTAKYSIDAITSAILAVTLPEELADMNDTSPHAYSVDAALVYDPGTHAASASGAIYYFWSLIDGSTPGLSGGTLVSSGNQTWTLTIPSGTSNGVTFTMTYGGVTTPTITFSTTDATFLTNLQGSGGSSGLTALFGASNVVVSTVTGTGPWVATFSLQGALSGVLLSNSTLTSTLGTVALIAGGGYDGVPYVATPTLTDYALLVDNAVRAVVPANITPRIGAVGGVNTPFDIIHVSSLSAKILWPTNTQINGTTFLDPASIIVRQGLQAYIQSLGPNEVPTVFGAAAYVTNYASFNNVTLNSLILTGVNGTNIVTSPLTPGTATAPSLYVCTFADITPTQVSTNNTTIALSQGYL